MSRILVVYYSLTGHTAQVARAIGERCGAELEPVREQRPRRGFRGLFRSAADMLTARRVALEPPGHDPAGYDLVVLGTPVWAARVSSPMRSWLIEHAADCERVAFFCTEGGSGGERMFERMQTLCGQVPVATLIVTEQDLREQRYARRLAAFVDGIGTRRSTGPEASVAS